MHASTAEPATSLIDRAGLAALIETLGAGGYTVLGPRVAGTAITYAPIASIDDLPRGCASAQSPGRYRVTARADDALFAYGPAADSLKRYLHPPAEPLWSAVRVDGTLRFVPQDRDAPKLAIVGVRACELGAIARLDAVFLHGPGVDRAYQARRAALVIVAVNCTEPGDTCFCASMGTGPRAASLYDLALTELADGRFVVRTGTGAGADLLAVASPREVTGDALAAEARALDASTARMGRTVATAGLAAALAGATEDPEWDAVAHRCLACANCTSVCPTCFCHTIDDRTDLAGERVARERRWDSCFGAEFSYIHGGSIRPSVRARYRQWLTHKFSTWTEQFGTFGCVGCGRCITWCPAGIDVTQEIVRLTARNGD